MVVIAIMTLFTAKSARSVSILTLHSGTDLQYSRDQLSEVKVSTTQQETRYIFVGAETCAGKCHNIKEDGDQYNKWKKSPHSRSFKVLATKKAARYCAKAGIKEKPMESLICLKCHITASEVDTASLSATYRKEDGVTCEACHKGEFIPKTFLPKEEDCLKCHNGSIHEISKFDFSDKCAKISHPKPHTKTAEN